MSYKEAVVVSSVLDSGSKQITNSFLVIILAAFSFACLGCGGGGSGTASNPQPPPPPPPPPATIQVKGGLSQFFHSISGFTTVVNAQNPPTVAITGTYAGYCPSFFMPTNPTQPIADVLYGAGSLVPPGGITVAPFYQCNFGGIAGNGLTPGEDAAENAATEAQPAPVFGSGNLIGLVAVDTPNSLATGATSGLVEVFVIRAGQVVPTGISCTLGLTRRCEDAVHTFAVVDGDGLVLTVTNQPGDNLQYVQVYVGKQ